MSAHIIQQPVCNWFELMKWTVCECTVQNKHFFNCSLHLERNSTDSGQGGIFLVYMCWACMLSNGIYFESQCVQLCAYIKITRYTLGFSGEDSSVTLSAGNTMTPLDGDKTIFCESIIETFTQFIQKHWLNQEWNTSTLLLWDTHFASTFFGAKWACV